MGDGNADGAPRNRIAGGPSPSQATEANQPLLQVKAGPGGRNEWQFDGTNDRWTFANSPAPLTIYLVGKTRRTVNGTAVAVGWEAVSDSQDDGAHVALNISTGQSRYVWNTAEGGFTQALVAGTSLDTYVVLAGRRDGTSLTVWRSNSATAGTATITGTPNTLTGNAVIGARYVHPSAISGFEQLNLIELIACAAVHPDRLRQQMSRLLAQRAGLTDISPL